jgi:energy-coupling factor transport system permease protein
VVPAAVVLAGAGFSAVSLGSSTEPLTWPALPAVPALAILVAATAAVAAPPPLRPARRRPTGPTGSTGSSERGAASELVPVPPPIEVPA